MEKILCCIFNHNDNVHAGEWAQRLSPHFDTVILDSGSSPRCTHPLSVPLDNVYYSGLMNEAFRRGKEGGYGWVMVVTSDLRISAGNSEKLIKAMKQVSAGFTSLPPLGGAVPWRKAAATLPEACAGQTSRKGGSI